MQALSEARQAAVVRRPGHVVTHGWGAFVRDKRKALGITRRELARRALVDPSYITLFESDNWRPHIKRIPALAVALGVSLDQCMLAAGYATPDLQGRVDRALRDPFRMLESPLRELVREWSKLDPAKQRAMGRALQQLMSQGLLRKGPVNG